MYRGGGLSRFDTLPQVRLGTTEIKMAAINGKDVHDLDDLTEKIGDCEQSKIE